MDGVVLYRFSTSNHNRPFTSPSKATVVLYRFSTSNHNSSCVLSVMHLLYYIVSLHQTTTSFKVFRTISGCIISFLYIKPQPNTAYYVAEYGCIISFLYIKPQLTRAALFRLNVVLYRFSTSNHNLILMYLLGL